MDPSSRFDADGDRSFQVLWEDGDRVFCRGRRRSADGDRDAVLAVVPATDHPTSTCLDRLAHEYGLRDELDGAWAVRPLEFVRDRGRTMLVLDDPGSEPLSRLVGAPLELGRFLRLGIGIANALGKAHRRGLVHKDIKPANILVNRTTAEVKLTGFGLTTRLPRERQVPEPPETIAGTLAYMAPEQTGRMNRSVDSRSDLYALGVTLYQMLTGVLPFSAADPMEWVHCHIARKPVPPVERSADVPAAVSAIIMKLLAKTAEERYQTAGGVERDLRRCLAEWETCGHIDGFPLGQLDTPDRLLIPEKLYGREREVETLLAAFDRVVSSGEPELVLVSGYSGIGKSSVINELHKVLVSPRGLFASGKFDQYKRDIPYSTVVQAFQGLVRPLLSKSDAELASWRASLLEALDSNGRLITDLVSELRLIIGDQPPVPELPPQDAQRRFQLVFRRFIGVFARPEHPLALFLDDLQWLDAATLDLIEDLLTRSDLRHLMLIGAYRDNEVDAAHPLRRKLDVIKTTGGKVAEIALEPLAREHVGELIADALRCEPMQSAPLAQIVQDKTEGNPFFAIQFLSSLAEEGMLRFDHDVTRWSWDLERIHAKRYTDNVVALMVRKLKRLPAETRKALQQLACLGNSAEITTLCIVLGIPEEQVHAVLWPAVRQEFIEHRIASYRFTHDRIQEGAYSLIPKKLRREVHLRIGRLLAAQVAPERQEEAIFDIVDQLNRGALLITSPEEREQLAELNLIAGKRAKAAAAYAAALAYFSSGTAHLAEDCWERHHELIFELELGRAECEFLTGALVDAQDRLTALDNRVVDTVERATVASLRVDLYTTMDQSSRALAVGIDYLRHAGIKWSSHPTEADARREYQRIWSLIGGRAIEDLIELPLMSDPASLATMDVLTKLEAPASFSDPNLHFLIGSTAVSLSLERGSSDGSCFAYEWIASVAGPIFGDYKTGFRFAQLGYELVEQRGLRRFQAKTYLNFGSLMLWTRPVRGARDLLRRAFDVATKTGNLNDAAFTRYLMTTNLLAAGDPLVDAQREAEHGLAFARKMGFGLVIDIAITQLALVRTLRGLTPKFGSFDDKDFEELRVERRLTGNPDLARAECWYWIRKGQARFFAGDSIAAVDALSKAQKLLWASPSNFEVAEQCFYGALSHAAACAVASKEQRQCHFDALAGYSQRLQVWAENCPDNFESRAMLVGAEIAGADGRDGDAMRLYEHAIRSARANGFIHIEALAYELAARFYAGRGFDEIAHLYLQNARHCYVRWGADGKVGQLDRSYPRIEHHAPGDGPMSTIGTPVEHLDLATVIKVSQAVSGEIVLEKLLDTLLRTALAQAGAERVLLLLLRGGASRITAEATTSGDTAIVRLRDAPVSEAELPVSVFNYVLRSQGSVILDDAVAQSPFAEDPYIRQRTARSILCLPVVNQAKLIGVLYLENNLAPRVFAPTRIAVLKLLASQAAIALENSHLYHDLAEREAKIRRLIDANIVGITIWDFDGCILEANDEFLRMVGYDRQDLVSGHLRWTDLTPPEWRDRAAQAAAELRMSGSFGPAEREYVRSDGSRVPLLIGSAAFGNGGNQGVSFLLDLTERKRAEAEASESEAKIRRLVDANIIGVTIWDVDGRIIDANDEFLRTIGYDREDLVSGHLRWTTLTPPEWHDQDAQSIVDLKMLRRVEPFEKEYFRKDGSRVPVLIGGAIFEGSDQGVAFVFDLTERKRADEALREVQMALAHASRVATMGQLTASIAHEVSQPIAATVTNAQAALRWLDTRSPDLKEVRQALARIVKDGNRAGDVVGRIRALIQKAPPRTDRLDINEATREVVELTRGEAVKNDVFVQTDLAEGLPLVHGDRVQLQQVILNLIINAIEAMTGVGEGARNLLISTGKAASGGVLVAVKDSGPGLDPASLERLFEPFYTTKHGGLGMGLSICRSIIDAHGGRLRAKANVPRGAVFQFVLPAHPDSAS